MDNILHPVVLDAMTCDAATAIDPYRQPLQRAGLAVNWSITAG